ncbi:uncharacterized protein LOC141596882 isoform X3 [Silene latifolia]|uniref:uncharacterized protein LOC141596882 isoform X3 n=1 Tax=Silene latifolia TaxID=37657 RepID=UPI003D779984
MAMNTIHKKSDTRVRRKLSHHCCQLLSFSLCHFSDTSSMADMNLLLQFPSSFLKSPLSFPFPLQLSSHHAFSPLHRRISLSSLIPHLSSPSNSPNFLLISTSQQSDGSLVFKFGDASEIPPAVENAEIEVELQSETDDYLAINDQPHSNELNNDDVEQDFEPKDFSQVEEMPACKEMAEKTEVDSVKDQQNPDNLVVASQVEDKIAECNVSISEENTSQSGSDVGRLDSEAALEDGEIEEEVSLKYEIIELPPLQLEAEPILDEEVSLKNEMIELDVDEGVQVIELPPVQLETEPVLDEEVSLKDEMIELNVDEAVQVIGLPPLQLQAEPILDEEVNYVGLPSIAGQDDSPSGDITDAAFPSLEESVVISETNINREEISLQSEDISALSRPISSASYPLKFNDAVHSAILQSDDNPESTDISEPAGPVPELSGIASEEAHLNGVQSSTAVISVPSAMASLPEATKVNDAITPSIQLSDADLHSEISVAADPGPGISAAAEINLSVENSAPSLCVVSAAASVAHTAEVLHVANIGDSGFIVVRNGTVFKKSSPMFHEFNFPYAVSFGENPVETVEEYHVELENGDIIVTATDGLFDNLYEREIASLVFKAVEDGKNVKDIAELLATRSQEVGRSPHARTPFADAAQAAGHPEFRGGKFDHVTVIVSIVQNV